MHDAGTKRLVVVSGTGPFDEGEGVPMRYLIKPLGKLFLRHVFADFLGMEAVVRASGLDWTIIRPPRLTDKPLTGTYRTERDENMPRTSRCRGPTSPTSSFASFPMPTHAAPRSTSRSEPRREACHVSLPSLVNSPTPRSEDGMRVLVAGGTGVIGRQLLPLLGEVGHDVIVLSRSAPAGCPGSDGRRRPTRWTARAVRRSQCATQRPTRS